MTSSVKIYSNTGVQSTRNTFHYTCGKILLVEFGPNGDRKWAKKIAKKQSTDDSRFYFSYYVSMITKRWFTDSIKRNTARQDSNLSQKYWRLSKEGDTLFST